MIQQGTACNLADCDSATANAVHTTGSLSRDSSVRAHKQSGFVLTIELILIVTILLIGSFVGIVAIRDALIKRYVNQQSQSVTVADSNGLLLGKAIGFDEHEAPRLFYIDRTIAPAAPDPAHRNYRALLAVRDDRFTSREPVYYEGENCTGTPCIKKPSDEASDSTGTTGITGTGAVGYLYGLQNINGPTYAIGKSPDGIQGYLYRSTENVCSVAPENLKSRYLSQMVIRESPCEPFTDPTSQPPDTSCIIDSVATECSCPAGYADQGDVIDRNAADVQAEIDSTVATLPGTVSSPTLGTVCCPYGSTLAEDADLVSALTFAVLDQYADDLPSPTDDLLRTAIAPLGVASMSCVVDFELREAIDVPDPNDATVNALSRFVAPFQVNLPTGGVSGDSWTSTPSDGGEGVTP